MTLYKWTNINEYVVYELCAGRVDTWVDDTVYINLHQYTNAYVDDKLCAIRIATRATNTV